MITSNDYTITSNLNSSQFVVIQYMITFTNSDTRYSIIKFKDNHYDGLYELYPYENDVTRDESIAHLLLLIDLDIDQVMRDYPEVFI